MSEEINDVADVEVKGEEVVQDAVEPQAETQTLPEDNYDKEAEYLQEEPVAGVSEEVSEESNDEQGEEA